MKLKKLLLVMGAMSSMAYANIPGTPPYKSITMSLGYMPSNFAYTVDSTGVIYSTKDGINWTNSGQFTSTTSPKYFAYNFLGVEGEFYNVEGNEGYKTISGIATRQISIPFNYDSDYQMEDIGSSGYVQYARICKKKARLCKFYYHSCNISWTEYTQLSGNKLYLGRMMAFGSTGDFMLLGASRQNTYIYDNSGLRNEFPLPGNCSTSNEPSLLQGDAGWRYNGASFSRYYLMCGSGNQATLYFNAPEDDGSRNKEWQTITSYFNPTSTGSYGYDTPKYVMASYPSAFHKMKVKVLDTDLVIKNPRISLIIDNSAGSAAVRLVVSGYDPNTKPSERNKLSYSISNPIAISDLATTNQLLYSGTIINEETADEPNLHGIFVGNDSASRVLDVPINFSKPDSNGVSTISIGSISFN